MRTIEFFKTSNGRCPVEEFLDALSDREAQKAAWVLRLVERMDRAPAQYFRKLIGTEDLWEVRAQIGGQSYRFLGFFDGPSTVILTNAFSKKREKTPIQEIELAHRRRTEYLQRRTRS